MTKFPFRLHRGLLYIAVSLVHEGCRLTLHNCIFDTGAAGSTFDADHTASLGLTFSPQSRIRRLTTVGGYQHVFTRTVDIIQIGSVRFPQCMVEIGDLTSGFRIDGIIGTAIIRQRNWKIDFGHKHLTMTRAASWR